MTVGVTWIRKAERGDELWFASDSRLTGDGNVWDDCPKLFALPRRDAAAAFSGSTAQAYPLLLQIANAIVGHHPAIDGTLEFTWLVEHLAEVVNSMLAGIERDRGVHGAADPRAFSSRSDVIVLGGFSRHTGGLVLRALRYDTATGRWKFTHARARNEIGPNKVYRVYGDNRAASRFHHLFEGLLADRGKVKTSKPFDFEPLEALWRFMELPESVERPLPAGHRPETVGGSPQVMQIRPGGAATPFVVRWRRDKEIHDYLLGRRVLPNENLDLPLIERVDGGLKVRGRGQWDRIGGPDSDPSPSNVGNA